VRRNTSEFAVPRSLKRHAIRVRLAAAGQFSCGKSQFLSTDIVAGFCSRRIGDNCATHGTDIALCCTERNELPSNSSKCNQDTPQGVT
jgi:hypothetical protein